MEEEILYEIPPILRAYKSGRIERFAESEFLPPGIDPLTGVTSKDVAIENGISARLYLPSSTGKAEKLPLLLYYHGGAFVIETPFSPTYHHYLTALVAKANVIAVSVHYRRVPEHPLPVAYEDSRAALRWAVDPLSSDPWLADRADFSRVFLAGDSAGANIVHDLALRGVGLPVRIEGVALVHPYFWGKEAVGSETREAATRETMEAMWRLVCPATREGTDDACLNPFAKGAPSLRGLACRRVMVSVAAEDLLKERGVWYYERLKESGWGGEAELAVTEGEGHVFHLLDRSSDKAAEEMERMVAFLNRKE